MTEHTLGYLNMKQYMLGWKDGAGAKFKVQGDGPYAEGYQAGMGARVKTQRETQKRFKVTDAEILKAVLR